MKKRILLIILALLVLSACSHKNKNQKVPGNWYTGSSSSTLASDKKETSDNSIYDVVLEKLRTDTSDTPATHYAYYDIDGNGQDELFSGRYWESTGTIEFAALYYDNNGVADYLAQSYVASVGGYREAANIYTDGTIITAKWTSTGTEMEDTQYQLRADNSGIDTIKSATVPICKDVELTDYFDVKNKETFDFSVLDWQPLVSEQANSDDLDVNQILSGNYESLAGTWVNGRGEVLTINANGMLDGDTKIFSASKNNQGLVFLAAGSIDGTPGGIAIGLFPIGVENPLGDYSDISKPRLVAGQQFVDFPAEAYYYRK
ncbi:DUF6287 domain-containing protein [Streptococcus equinus]|uniref:DUF6287 domain-containing protein n=1 Tax=Streptococcus equinus TaxID=1335 RepID=UPI0008EA16B2|nr:DUF6287 domain-containing protein [Streptococcus equinus]SFB92579.1 filamentous hemagglutinin family N-terminal domain-containing protein [Streptococcus equinus]